MLSGAYTLKLKGHVAVDIIARFVPPRGKQILDLATSLLIIFFCAIMIWQGTKTAYQSMMVWETSNNTAFNPPVWWFRWIIPISAALILLQSIADFLKTLLTPGKGGADSGS
jgi:TRAP-type mannitol/chloroaromatic compound transport system permease small subunit